MSTSGGNPSKAYLTETTSVPTKKAASSIETSARAALPLAVAPYRRAKSAESFFYGIG
jgi:hypothetical protein